MLLLAAASLDLLAVNPGLLIWTLVTFLVVLVILWLFAWKPIIRALDERNAKIEGDLKESEELRLRAEKLLRDYEEKMEKARSEAMELLEEGKRDAEVQREKILKQAQEEAKHILEKAQQEIELAKVKAISEVEDSVIALSSELMRRIFRDRLSIEEHRKLLSEELAALRKGQGK
ncbi:MAG: F0F1 ATP synthase subunit B [Leptospiraceae bacterium]|nr:F0F1 ATP synthase subunit B [Leptospiraceae bacterium]MDW8306029.1 F0F1 ATP synthase subunit B [Leptospiraceae bacterium]